MDAHTSLLTLCEFTFVTVPFGIATATTIRVGNMLGANKPGAAQRAGELPLLPAIDPADDAKFSAEAVHLRQGRPSACNGRDTSVLHD